MKYILFYMLLNSCVTTEYHAASPLSMAGGLNIEALNKYNIEYECPKDDDQLLCTYANILLTDKGYIKEQQEGKKERPTLNISLESSKIKDYGSGTFDFVFWILSITTWPYETQKFFKIDISISTEQKIKLKDSFYAHYRNNYRWVYTLTRWIRGKINKDKKLCMEEAGSKDLYEFIETSIESSVSYIEMESM